MSDLPTVGVEEELAVVDRSTGRLVGRARDLLDALPEHLRGNVEHELKQCQIELVSPVCDTLDDVAASLVGLRSQVAAAADGLGLAIAAGGTHPVSGWQHQAVTPKAAYRQLEEDYQRLTDEQLVFGCHVHVCVDDPDRRIAALDWIRPWLATLLALTANSPYWEGADTGLYTKIHLRVSTLDGDVLAWVYVLDGYEGGLPSARTLGLIAEAAEAIAVLRAANTSVGVALLADLIERAARVLGPEWDIEIAETHHRKKADAPSGTALLLGDAAARGRGAELKAERGRAGIGLEREPGAIGFASLRGGTVAGEHDVLFLGLEERLTLSHKAESRMIFARGALAGARFLVGKPAGLYSMRDVIDSL